jgi:class 3 adenylate cyclase
MRCSKCGKENRESRKFCAKCGAPLTVTCSKCGAPNQPEEDFCGECGTALGDAAPVAADGKHSVTASAGGERRHLTILFCDLVGSVTLTSQLDPEEWRATVAGYQRSVSEAVTRFGGEVVRYIGDGIMAFFGYPVAHENDAERAVRASLAILDGVAKLNELHPSRPNLSVRIGIDSGSVVVGAGLGQAVDAFGNAANIAARVQGAAMPNTVVVTAATHRLISGLFIAENCGTQTLKGIEQPVQLYQIIRPSGMRGRLAAAAAAGALTPFVGRQDELRLLLSRWERAREGDGQVVTIVGEAGIGKSRLVQEFHSRIAVDRHTWLECATAAFFQNTPFYAVGEMLRDSFRWHKHQNDEQRLGALEASLSAAGVELVTAVPLIASLLEMPLGDKYPRLTMPPDQQRKRLLATLVAWTIGAAQDQPLVIATEDLHWADPSTLEVTQLLVEQGLNAPLLLIYTTRPELRASWSTREHHTQITLNRLGVLDIRVLVAQVASYKALPDETVAAVVERAGGVPLFAEELTRAVLESAEGRLSGAAIPVTLHDSLVARLDRLGTAKEVAQIGAVIGAEFSYELLRAVHPISEPELQNALRSLIDAELLYARGIAPEATYQFKHALIRDAAYEALLKTRRKELHLVVARTIDEQFPVLKDLHPEILAHHWSEADQIEPAIHAWRLAGQSAAARSAFVEAQQHWTTGLELIRKLPESQERDRDELRFRIGIVNMLRITKGELSREAGAAVQQAAELAERSGNVTAIADWTGYQSYNLWINGHLTKALDRADQSHLLRLRIGNPTRLAYSYLMEVHIHCMLGHLMTANEYFEKGLTFFDDARFRADPTGAVVSAFSHGSWTAWLLGLLDVAHERLECMIASTNADNPHTVAMSGYHEAQLRIFMGE